MIGRGPPSGRMRPVLRGKSKKMLIPQYSTLAGDRLFLFIFGGRRRRGRRVVCMIVQDRQARPAVRRDYEAGRGELQTENVGAYSAEIEIEACGTRKNCRMRMR